MTEDKLITLLNKGFDVNNKNNQGFTEDEIIETVNYKRRKCRKERRKSVQKFITTSKSRIKNKLIKAVLDACIDVMRLNKFNPFKEVSKIEAIDIDYPEDFDIANAVYKEVIKHNECSNY